MIFFKKSIFILLDIFEEEIPKLKQQWIFIINHGTPGFYLFITYIFM